MCPQTYVVGKGIYGLPVSVSHPVFTSGIYDESVLLGQNYMASHGEPLDIRQNSDRGSIIKRPILKCSNPTN